MPTAPTAPTAVCVSPGDGSAVVSWTAPTSDGGSAIVGYLLRPYLDGVALPDVLHCGAPVARTVNGLTDGGSYRFTVLAFNDVGTSPESPASNTVTVGLTPTVPAGYSRAWVTDLSVPNGRVLDGSGNVLRPDFRALWSIPASHQSGTKSISKTSNFVTSGNGLATWRATDTYSGDPVNPYTSAYGKTVSSFFQPLTGRYEAMMRFPMGHSVWPCFWMDAGGSSDRFEIDAAEMFLSQTPGRASVVFHSAAHYSTNMNGSAAWDSGFTYHVPSAGGAAFTGPDTASTRYGKKAFDWATTLLPDARPWVKVAVEIDKVTGAAGYTIRIRIYWNDRLLVTWVDPFNPATGTGTDKNGVYTGDKPRWVQSYLSVNGNNESLFWDWRWDCWIGGRWIGDATTDANAMRQTYDGKLQGDGLDAARPNGYPAGPLVPSTSGRWPMDMDVAWMQRLTKNP